MVMIMMIDQDEYEQSTNSQQQQQICKQNHTQNTQQSTITLWPCHLQLKSILRQKKKNYGNSNISPGKKYNLQKNSSTRNQNPSTYYY